MKKITAFLLASAVAVMSLAGCTGSSTGNQMLDGPGMVNENADPDNDNTAAELTDWEYIKNKGEFVVGITLYEPMNYYDENGKLTGFDTEFAEAVAELTGVKVKFQEIEWDQKEMELKSKKIDAIWNGLTVTEERKENMAFSTSYVVNQQVVVIKKSNADKYKSLADLKGATICAESGSAGESAIEADANLSEASYVASSAQKDALLEVKAGTCDAAVLDLTLAQAVINDDTDYSDLMIMEGTNLQSEEYAIGMRLEDVETVKVINEAIAKLLADGTLAKLGEKYGIDVITE